MTQFGRTRTLRLNWPRTNWCPFCKVYINQNHNCKLAAPEASRSLGDSGAASPLGEVMSKKKAAANKSSHREGVLYRASAKLVVDKLKRQALAVGKALNAFSTPKDLATIAAKAKELGLESKTPVIESTHYHLRRFVADGLAIESKVEAPKSEAASA